MGKNKMIRRKMEQAIKEVDIKEIDIEVKKLKKDKYFGVVYDGITREDIEEESNLYTRDQKRIEKKYNSKAYPNFRLTAEYLIRKYLDKVWELNKKEVCKDLHIQMGTLDKYLSELNRYERFQPMRWISVQNKKNFIEVAGINFRNSNIWIKKNFKGTISRTARVYQTKEKVKLAEEEKAYKEKMKYALKSINKNRS